MGKNKRKANLLDNDTEFANSKLNKSTISLETPYLSVYIQARNTIPSISPYLSITYRANAQQNVEFAPFKRQPLEFIPSAQPAKAASVPAQPPTKPPTPAIIKPATPPAIIKPATQTQTDTQVPKQAPAQDKKRSILIFLVALLSLAGIALVFLSRLIPSLSIGMDIFAFHAIREIGFSVYVLSVCYVIVMQLCFALAILCLFSEEKPSFEWFALSGVLVAIIFAIVKTDLLSNSDFASIFSQKGLLLMVWLPLFILLLNPFCMIKRKD